MADKTILIVDDTPANIAAALAILKDQYRTKVATSGAKALEHAGAADKPDLILLDVTMPEMDGYEVCARLKADPKTAAIPVVFLTARTEAEDEAKGFELGSVDYIHKPFNPTVVRARVQTHLLLRDTLKQIEERNAALDEKTRMLESLSVKLSKYLSPQVVDLRRLARRRAGHRTQAADGVLQRHKRFRLDHRRHAAGRS
jgi:sigma-B regulation protein RsbU (phosphoserine phosphatase)